MTTEPKLARLLPDDRVRELTSKASDGLDDEHALMVVQCVQCAWEHGVRMGARHALEQAAGVLRQMAEDE